jgi:dihydrofolate reductase
MFSLIIATDIKHGIGKNGTLPWKNSTDMQNFKKLTTDNVIIMGRKTWDSLPKRPLPNRINIVISTTLITDDALVFPSIKSLMDFKLSEKDTKSWFIIGGSSLYNYFLKNLHLLDSIYFTQMHDDFECDIKIDKFNLDKKCWMEIISDRSETMNRNMIGATYYEFVNIG